MKISKTDLDTCLSVIFNLSAEIEEAGSFAALLKYEDIETIYAVSAIIRNFEEMLEDSSDKIICTHEGMEAILKYVPKETKDDPERP